MISLPLIASEKDKSQPATSQTTQSDRPGFTQLELVRTWGQWATFQKPRVVYVREDQASGQEPLTATTDDISSISKPLSNAERVINEGLKCNGAGSDMLVKAGSVTAAIVVKGISDGYNRGKYDVIDLATRAIELGTIISVSAAAPVVGAVVGGTAIVTGTGYAGYKLFRYFKPTPKMVAQNNEEMAEIEHKTDAHHSESVKHKSTLAKHIEEQFKLAQCKKFNNCLEKNRRSISFTTYGLPLECEDEAFNVSLHDDGDDRIQLLAKKFAKYAPRPG